MRINPKPRETEVRHAYDLAENFLTQLIVLQSYRPYLGFSSFGWFEEDEEAVEAAKRWLEHRTRTLQELRTAWKALHKLRKSLEKAFTPLFDRLATLHEDLKDYDDRHFHAYSQIDELHYHAQAWFLQAESLYSVPKFEPINSRISETVDRLGKELPLPSRTQAKLRSRLRSERSRLLMDIEESHTSSQSRPIRQQTPEERRNAKRHIRFLAEYESWKTKEQAENGRKRLSPKDWLTKQSSWSSDSGKLFTEKCRETDEVAERVLDLLLDAARKHKKRAESRENQ
jgi:hypothetical protein